MKFARESVSISVLTLALITLLAAGQAPAKSASGFKLETSAFMQGGDIPAKYTCSGENISPALTWTDPPTGTKGFALIVEDPDDPGGTFTHWVVIGIKPEARELPEGINKTGSILQSLAGGMQNTNDFGRTGYDGPCPPPGKPHRYFFRLYALNSPLNFLGNIRANTRRAVDQAMKGHILAEASVMGKFQRQ